MDDEIDKENNEFYESEEDGYFHSSPMVAYSSVNIPGPGVNVHEFESQLAIRCSCIDGLCFQEIACECIFRYKRNYYYSKLLPTKYNGPIVECNSTCACYKKHLCDNRVVQYGPLQDLEVFEVTGKGKALRCKSDIEQGTFVCEYAGEVIGAEEATRRMLLQGPNDMNYIFHLKEHLANGSTIHTYVDPSFIGNVGRYINHSCDANCIVVPVRTDSSVPRLGIFASSYISAGEEITFDYGSSSSDYSEQNIIRKPCLCGTSRCRSFLPFEMTTV